MPGYGLPKTRKGLLTWRWADTRLRRSRQYWITTVRPNGAPHAVVIWGLWMNGCFYFSTGARSRKAKNLVRNPRCVICTDNAAQAVVVEGRAAVLNAAKNEVLLKRFARLYEQKYKWDMSDFDEPVYVVVPRVALGLYERQFVQSATRWNFR